MSRWTKEYIETLKKLWYTHTSAEIAKILGNGFTRNSVIGKINRLGLSKKGVTNNISAARKISNCQPFVGLIGKEWLIKGVMESYKHRNTCEWPFDHPKSEEFYFCEKPVYKKKPYCKAHYLEAYKSKSNIS